MIDECRTYTLRPRGTYDVPRQRGYAGIIVGNQDRENTRRRRVLHK